MGSVKEKWWDDLSEEEQYKEYLDECIELKIPALSFEEWKEN